MSEKYCIIGAGASGLTAARHLQQQQIPFDCLEREDHLGGLWNLQSSRSSIYSTTHLISSKQLTQFPDFPMPQHYPPYPHHQQVLVYLQDYARHFDLVGQVQTGCQVQRVERADGHWQVQVGGEAAPRRYRGLVIANGHHWDANRPSLPGEQQFGGTVIHSQQYKSPQQLYGRRVLVVGAGNSGCDIAVEAAQHAQAAYLSMRRGYYFLPKFVCGLPADQAGELLDGYRLPMALRRAVARILLRFSVGPLSRYGLPKPDHRLFESHPIVNSQLPYFVGHGRVTPKGPIASLGKSGVRFQDGTEAEVDLIILATGYRLSFPFIDLKHLNARDGRPRLFLHAFHPHRDDVFVIGMLQPNGGLWPLSHYQAAILAAFLSAMRAGRPQADWFRRRRQRPLRGVHAGIHYVDSPRHQLEVEYFAYRRAARRLLRRMGG